MEYSEKANNKRTKAINHQMPRISNTGNASNTDNTTEEQIHQMLVDNKNRNEFGLFEFLNPYVQVPFEKAQEEYKKKYKLKEAYDKQEFLRKMRADIKREYLTRKKQLKRLQTDAAVAFREAETRLQEHYSEEFARTKGRRAVDISMPLVSCVEIREGETIDLKSFNIQQEFQGLRNMQNDIYQCEKEGVIQFVRRRKEEEELLAQQQDHQQETREVSWNEWVGSSDDDDGNGNGNMSDTSYDSDYCAEFGYYPRDYIYERQMREDEEARVAQAARLRAEHEAEAAAEDAAEAERRRRWHDMSPEEEQQLWFKNTRGVNDPWSEDDDNDADFIEEEEHPCDEVIAPAVSVSASTSAQSSRDHNNNHATKNKKAAKARIAKQQQKQQKQQTNQQANKYVPVQVTDNTNRTNQVTAILTTNKLEINLPKKNLQNVSREAIKRHNQKWNRINALAKQSGSGARGTKVATLRDPRPWHNNDSYCYEEGDC